MNEPSEQHKSCAVVQKELLEIFDEASFDRLTEPIAGHLSDCSECKNEIQELVSLSRELKNLPVPVPEDSYWVRYLPQLRARLDARQSAFLARKPVWAPSLAVAALFSLFVILSPVKIAPPSWFQADTMIATTDQILKEEELSKLEKLFTVEATTDSKFDQLELNLIHRLSQLQYETPMNLYDQLAQVDEETLDKILSQLSAKPII